MVDPLIVIFTLINDRTQLYLQGLGLADCFHEDADLATITFAERRGLSQNPAQWPADLVLIYDGRLSRQAGECLRRLCVDRTVQVIQHRGNAEAGDRLRLEQQSIKLTAVCPQLLKPLISEHASCGFVYDTMMLLAASIKRGDQESYRFCLQRLKEKSHPDRHLEQLLRLLHLCLTPQGAQQVLETEKTQPALFSLADTDSARARSLIQLLADSPNALAVDYQNTLIVLRSIVLTEDAS